MVALLAGPTEACNSPKDAGAVERTLGRTAHAAPARAVGFRTALPPVKLGREAPPPAASAEPLEPPAPCPKEMTPVGSACIDRYEAHLLLQDEHGTLTPHPHYQRPPATAKFVAASAPAVKPQGYISRIEAQSACEAAAKRLCTLDEWYRACRGQPPLTYGYSHFFEPKRCNVGKPHLLSRLFGTNGKAWRYEEHFNSPRLLQEPGFLALTGEYSECASSSAAQDMVGNLHEWVSDRADFELASKLPMLDMLRRTLSRNRGKGVFMGGFFSTTSEHGRGCNFITFAHEPKYHDYSTGFRCCQNQ